MALGSLSHDDEDFKPEINTTPLVDVMLVLLIVFMVTLPAMTQQAAVELPRADAAPLSPAPSVQLAVRADGSVSWNGQVVAEADLGLHMEAAARQQPVPEIHLQADRRVPYDHVARTLAAAQTHGLTRIAFVTEAQSR